MESLTTLAATQALDYFTIITGLLGGLALFLYGMDMMADSLKRIAGDGLRKLLSKLTTNRFTGAIAGAVVTSIIQSSSITTVLVVGFISAGLMNFSHSIGIIMGANIGTTVTAQIIAFKVTKYALTLIALGFGMKMLIKRNRWKQFGALVMGLGLIFFGMQLMSEGTKPLQSFQPFIDTMKNMDSTLIAILFGALFTALVQSSSATTGIVIVLASQGFLSLSAGIALIFGANIGTCFTAWLSSLGKPIEAKRAVGVHILFNVAGVMAWFFLIPQLAELVRAVSPQETTLSGAAKLAAETPRQVANAHTIFNVTNTLLFIGLTGPIAKLIMRIYPDKPDLTKGRKRNTNLDEGLLETPALALEAARMEIKQMGASAVDITNKALDTVISGEQEDIVKLQEMDNQIDILHQDILHYLSKLSLTNLNRDESKALRHYLTATNYLENIGDMVETNLVEAGSQRLAANLTMSLETQKILQELHSLVAQQVQIAIQAITEPDPELAAALAEKVIQKKKSMNKLALKAERHLANRLTANSPNRLIAFHLESELIEYLKRMYYFAKRIAKLVD